MLRRLVGYFGAALLFSAGAIALIGRLGRDWDARVAVRGHSMAPGLRDGDWLLVDAGAFRRGPPRAGELVVARDPRAVGRVVVKRVLELTTDSQLVLGSDHPAHAEDRIGPLPSSAVLGRPWLRYWPWERRGRIS